MRSWFEVQGLGYQLSCLPFRTWGFLLNVRSLGCGASGCVSRVHHCHPLVRRCLLSGVG